MTRNSLFFGYSLSLGYEFLVCFQVLALFVCFDFILVCLCFCGASGANSISSFGFGFTFWLCLCVLTLFFVCLRF